MSFKRITPADLAGKGNVGKPDTPGVSTAEMQRILDEIPREVIVPAFNALEDQLEAGSAAAQLGAAIPGNPGELPGNPVHTVQGVLEALLEYGRSHRRDASNPHRVTAGQVGAYSREETEQKISERVHQIGASDMTKAEYGGSGPGIVKKADNAGTAQWAHDAEKLAGLTPECYAYSDSVRIFTATFRLNNWIRSGGAWTQTVTCSGIKAAYRTSPPWIIKTGSKTTDETLQDALNQLNDGLLETLEGQLRATVYVQPPSCDIQVYVQRRDETTNPDGGFTADEVATSAEVNEMLNKVFQ